MATGVPAVPEIFHLEEAWEKTSHAVFSTLAYQLWLKLVGRLEHVPSSLSWEFEQNRIWKFREKDFTIFPVFSKSPFFYPVRFVPEHRRQSMSCSMSRWKNESSLVTPDPVVPEFFHLERFHSRQDYRRTTEWKLMKFGANLQQEQLNSHAKFEGNRNLWSWGIQVRRKICRISSPRWTFLAAIFHWIGNVVGAGKSTWSFAIS